MCKTLSELDARRKCLATSTVLRHPGSFVVENACFAASDGHQCEYADTLEGYAKLRGINDRDRAKHPWDRQGFDRRGASSRASGRFYDMP